MKKRNLIGKPFGRLTVVSFVEIRGSHAYWMCRCKCGKRKTIRGSHLRARIIRSCGCMSAQKASIRLKKYARSPKHKGIGNPQWLGDKTKVAGIHNWLSRHFTKTKCAKCPSKKLLDWALKTGHRYSHNRAHFLVLCRGCHMKYDYASSVRKPYARTA